VVNKGRRKNLRDVGVKVELEFIIL